MQELPWGVAGIVSGLKINLGCGETFLTSEDWSNLDYSPVNSTVTQADLLAPLPFASGTVSLVYSSHFVEHIPREKVDGFLRECFRILEPGGMIRLVLPDFEEMCREYLARRGAGEHEKADFVIVEIVDQCVRMKRGGELGDLYRRVAECPEKHEDLIAYIHFRNGDILKKQGESRIAPSKQESFPKQVVNKMRGIKQAVLSFQENFRRWKIGFLISLLPDTYRQQQVCMASHGERHQWLWDYHQISVLLRRSSFVNIKRHHASTSSILDFPFFPLDLDQEGKPRKGAESMHIEAQKPW